LCKLKNAYGAWLLVWVLPGETRVAVRVLPRGCLKFDSSPSRAGSPGRNRA